jgi:hypothetical protein
MVNRRRELRHRQQSRSAPAASGSLHHSHIGLGDRSPGGWPTPTLMAAPSMIGSRPGWSSPVLRTALPGLHRYVPVAGVGVVAFGVGQRRSRGCPTRGAPRAARPRGPAVPPRAADPASRMAGRSTADRPADGTAGSRRRRCPSRTGPVDRPAPRPGLDQPDRQVSGLGSGDVGDVVVWTDPYLTDRVQQMGPRGATGLQDGDGCWSRSTGGRRGRRHLADGAGHVTCDGFAVFDRHATTAAPSGMCGVHDQDPIQPFTPDTARQPLHVAFAGGARPGPPTGCTSSPMAVSCCACSPSPCRACSPS